MTNFYLDPDGTPYFSKLPRWIVLNVFPNLKSRSIKIYCLLLELSNFTNGFASCSQRFAKSQTGMAFDTIKKAFYDLRSSGLIQTESFSSREPDRHQLARDPDQQLQFRLDFQASQGDPLPSPSVTTLSPPKTPSAPVSGALSAPVSGAPLKIKIKDEEYYPSFNFESDLSVSETELRAMDLMIRIGIRGITPTELLCSYPADMIISACLNSFYLAADRMANLKKPKQRSGRRSPPPDKFNAAGYVIATLKQARKENASEIPPSKLRIELDECRNLTDDQLQRRRRDRAAAHKCKIEIQARLMLEGSLS